MGRGYSSSDLWLRKPTSRGACITGSSDSWNLRRLPESPLPRVWELWGDILCRTEGMVYWHWFCSWMLVWDNANFFRGHTLRLYQACSVHSPSLVASGELSGGLPILTWQRCCWAPCCQCGCPQPTGGRTLPTLPCPSELEQRSSFTSPFCLLQIMLL